MQSILRDIKQGKFAKVYVLYGEEPYFLKTLSKAFENEVVAPESKDFNQHILYGKDCSVSEVIQRARALPMFSDRTLVLVREAQHLSRQLDQLEAYLDYPNPDTVLVLVMHQKSLDKRAKVVKRLAKEQVVFESKQLYENEVARWLDNWIQSRGISFSNEAKQLLLFSLGTELERYDSELEKLLLAEPGIKNVELDHIERHIGISKEFNVFELTRAISMGDAQKTSFILSYFAKNAKDHPLVLTLSFLYPFFVRVFKYHSLSNKADAPKALGISPYFLKEYEAAASRYSMKKITPLIHEIRVLDLKSKGVNRGSMTSETQLYQELMMLLRP